MSAFVFGVIVGAVLGVLAVRLVRACMKGQRHG